MLPIQYNCCKCKGNQLGKQACCILAQQYHIQSYTEKHPEEFKENAKKYKTMNRPKVIKKVCADNLLLTSIDYFLDESEDQLSVYHADYSSEEWHGCRNERSVRPLRPKTPQLFKSTPASTTTTTTITTTTTTPPSGTPGTAGATLLSQLSIYKATSTTPSSTTIITTTTNTPSSPTTTTIPSINQIQRLEWATNHCDEILRKETDHCDKILRKEKNSQKKKIMATTSPPGYNNTGPY